MAEAKKSTATRKGWTQTSRDRVARTVDAMGGKNVSWEVVAVAASNKHWSPTPEECREVWNEIVHLRAIKEDVKEKEAEANKVPDLEKAVGALGTRIVKALETQTTSSEMYLDEIRQATNRAADAMEALLTELRKR